MGSGCSSGEDAKHHRENHKNRINPTESYDKWQQKMLLDISADPLAVIRDFPRMTVFVHTDTRRSSLPEADNTVGDGAGAVSSLNPQRQESLRQTSGTNPLTLGTSNQSPSRRVTNVEKSTTGATNMDRASRKPDSHKNRGKKKSTCSPLPSHTLIDSNSVSSGTWVSPTVSPLLPPRPPPNSAVRGGTGACCSSTRELNRNSDAFAARMQRVRGAVLLLSELCNERTTFGVAFENAWDRLVTHGSAGIRANSADNDAAGDSATGPTQDGPVPPSFKKGRNQPIALDVHQVLLNACVESGMLMYSEEVPSAPTFASSVHGAAHSRSGTSAPAPLPLHIAIPPCLAKGTPWPDSTTSRPKLVPAKTATILGAGGTTEQNGDAARCDESRTPDSDSVHHHDTREYGVSATSSDHAPPVRAESNTVLSTCSPATTYSTTPTRYTVRSATFHLMQFTTQGVVFFPVQRLKHVLWMPWASHMQDVAWTIHFSIKEATQADLIARKQHQLDTLYNTSTSQLSPNVDSAAVVAAATAVAAAAGVDGRRGSPSAAPAPTVGTAGGDADGWRSPAIAGSEASKNVTRKTHGLLCSDAQCKGKVIVIQHVQTGRHYVEDGKRKTTPRYELDWACSIRVDQDTLLKMFAPYLENAVSAQDARAPPLSGRLSPLHSQSAFGSEVVTRAPPSLSHPPHHHHHHGNGKEYQAAVDAESPSSDATLDNGVETALPRKSVVPPAVALPLSPPNADVGMRTAHQQQLHHREVIHASVEVISARLEKPPRTLCTISSTWRKRKEELDYVLQQQYNVRLEQVDELPEKMLY
ncbi:hypothetical protein JKF63_04171 [Porcisia hertigi]|uniref:Uncharacterized protein n=1 Tax=Porcisia hertigi TaxID=2761500 RepID=A0A836HZL9_9TRYP|nr:hypothetical protein JKF63_04171 [Porcisia hertigi]